MTWWIHLPKHQRAAAKAADECIALNQTIAYQHECLSNQASTIDEYQRRITNQAETLVARNAEVTTCRQRLRNQAETIAQYQRDENDLKKQLAAALRVAADRRDVMIQRGEKLTLTRTQLRNAQTTVATLREQVVTLKQEMVAGDWVLIQEIDGIHEWIGTNATTWKELVRDVIADLDNVYQQVQPVLDGEICEEMRGAMNRLRLLREYVKELSDKWTLPGGPDNKWPWDKE